MPNRHVGSINITRRVSDCKYKFFFRIYGLITKHDQFEKRFIILLVLTFC